MRSAGKSEKEGVANRAAFHEKHQQPFGCCQQDAHAWKQQAGLLQLVAVFKVSVRARVAKLWDRWRDNVGGGRVSREAHLATLLTHASKVAELEVTGP